MYHQPREASQANTWTMTTTTEPTHQSQYFVLHDCRCRSLMWTCPTLPHCHRNRLAMRMYQYSNRRSLLLCLDLEFIDKTRCSATTPKMTTKLVMSFNHMLPQLRPRWCRRSSRGMVTVRKSTSPVHLQIGKGNSDCIGGMCFRSYFFVYWSRNMQCNTEVTVKDMTSCSWNLVAFFGRLLCVGFVKPSP